MKRENREQDENDAKMQRERNEKRAAKQQILIFPLKSNKIHPVAQ